MKKKHTFLIVFGLLGIGMLLALYRFQETIITKIQNKRIGTTELSDRSRQYLAEQESNDLLRTADLDESASGPKTVSAPGCFSMYIPFDVINEREDGECNWHYQIGRPRGFISASLTDKSISRLDDEPGVQLRRSRSHEYEESTYTTNEGTRFLVFERIEGEHQYTAFNIQYGGMLTVTFVPRDSRDFTEDFHKLLDSVELE